MDQSNKRWVPAPLIPYPLQAGDVTGAYVGENEQVHWQLEGDRVIGFEIIPFLTSLFEGKQ